MYSCVWVCVDTVDWMCWCVCGRPLWGCTDSPLKIKPHDALPWGNGFWVRLACPPPENWPWWNNPVCVCVYMCVPQICFQTHHVSVFSPYQSIPPHSSSLTVSAAPPHALPSFNILFSPILSPPPSLSNPQPISTFSTLWGWTHITFFRADLDLIKLSQKKIRKLGWNY